MLPKRAYLISGIFFILLGFLFLISSFSSITGFAIFENVSSSAGSILGIVFVVGGILIASMKRQEAYRSRESKLKGLMGQTKYNALADKDKIAYNTSYRRYLERIGKTKKEPEVNVAEQIREIMKEYSRRKIDYVDVAEELRKFGKFTGGTYKPPKQLSVYINGIRYKLPGIKADDDLALEIERRIPPVYQDNAEFHYNRNMATKHHTRELKKHLAATSGRRGRKERIGVP